MVRELSPAAVKGSFTGLGHCQSQTTCLCAAGEFFPSTEGEGSLIYTGRVGPPLKNGLHRHQHVPVVQTVSPSVFEGTDQYISTRSFDPAPWTWLFCGSGNRAPLPLLLHTPRRGARPSYVELGNFATLLYFYSHDHPRLGHGHHGHGHSHGHGHKRKHRP